MYIYINSEIFNKQTFNLTTGTYLAFLFLQKNRNFQILNICTRKDISPSEMIKRRSKSVQFYFFRDHELFTLQKKKSLKAREVGCYVQRSGWLWGQKSSISGHFLFLLLTLLLLIWGAFLLRKHINQLFGIFIQVLHYKTYICSINFWLALYAMMKRLGLSTIYSGASDIHTNALDALVFRWLKTIM